jgi:hypothetical protein
MPTWKRLLWEFRIWRGIHTVRRLKSKKKVPVEGSAWIMFLEYTGFSCHLMQCTSEERDIIITIFTLQWKGRRRLSDIWYMHVVCQAENLYLRDLLYALPYVVLVIAVLACIIFGLPCLMNARP